MNILIYAKKEDTQHKHLGPLDSEDRAYWTVNGKPQKSRSGDRIFFHDGEMVYAMGMIEGIEDGKIWFTPLERFKAYAEKPPTRGFKYIDGWPTPPCRLCGEKSTTRTGDASGLSFWCDEHAPDSGQESQEEGDE